MDHIRNLILDMDGVLWRGSTAISGLSAFIDTLRRKQINFVFATNNASKTLDEYVTKFAGFNVTITPEQVLTAGYTTANHLAKQFPQRGNVYILGYNGLHHAMRQAGFTVINEQNVMLTPADIPPFLNANPHADLVVVGFNLNATYTDFSLAHAYINQGAQFYGSNADSSFPHEIGTLPGAGSFLALLTTSTGKTPTVIGKPHRFIFEEALERLNGTPENTAIIGDRLNTDVAGANNVGITSILVYTGITTPQDVAASDTQPDYIFDGITAIGKALPS